MILCAGLRLCRSRMTVQELQAVDNSCEGADCGSETFLSVGVRDFIRPIAYAEARFTTKGHAGSRKQRQPKKAFGISACDGQRPLVNR